MRSTNTYCFISVFVFALFLSVAAGTAAAQIDETGGNRRPITRVKIQKIVKVVKVPEVRYQKISGVVITTVQPNADVSFRAASGGRYRQAKKTDADGVQIGRASCRERVEVAEG